jgi:uncharacterized protein
METIHIGDTANTGKGVFASIRFKKNQVLFKVEGKLKVEPYDLKYFIGARWFGIDDQTWLSTFRNSYAYYLNHSCNPNSGIRDKVVIVAMRDIEKGEEITLDYSITEADPYWKMKCKCGNRNCRTTIRSIQFLPDEIYRRYEPFVPEFLRRVRMRMND